MPLLLKFHERLESCDGIIKRIPELTEASHDDHGITAEDGIAVAQNVMIHVFCTFRSFVGLIKSMVLCA